MILLSGVRNGSFFCPELSQKLRVLRRGVQIAPMTLEKKALCAREEIERLKMEDPPPGVFEKETLFEKAEIRVKTTMEKYSINLLNLDEKSSGDKNKPLRWKCTVKSGDNEDYFKAQFVWLLNRVYDQTVESDTSCGLPKPEGFKVTKKFNTLMTIFEMVLGEVHHARGKVQNASVVDDDSDSDGGDGPALATLFKSFQDLSRKMDEHSARISTLESTSEHYTNTRRKVVNSDADPILEDPSTVNGGSVDQLSLFGNILSLSSDSEGAPPKRRLFEKFSADNSMSIHYDSELSQGVFHVAVIKSLGDLSIEGEMSDTPESAEASAYDALLDALRKFYNGGDGDTGDGSASLSESSSREKVGEILRLNFIKTKENPTVPTVTSVFITKNPKPRGDQSSSAYKTLKLFRQNVKKSKEKFPAVKDIVNAANKIAAKVTKPHLCTLKVPSVAKLIRSSEGVSEDDAARQLLLKFEQDHSTLASDTTLASDKIIEDTQEQNSINSQLWDSTLESVEESDSMSFGSYDII